MHNHSKYHFAEIRFFVWKPYYMYVATIGTGSSLLVPHKNFLMADFKFIIGGANKEKRKPLRKRKACPAKSCDLLLT